MTSSHDLSTQHCPFAVLLFSQAHLSPDAALKLGQERDRKRKRAKQNTVLDRDTEDVSQCSKLIYFLFISVLRHLLSLKSIQSTLVLLHEENHFPPFYNL